MTYSLYFIFLPPYSHISKVSDSSYRCQGAHQITTGLHHGEAQQCLRFLRSGLEKMGFVQYNNGISINIYMYIYIYGNTIIITSNMCPHFHTNGCFVITGKKSRDIQQQSSFPGLIVVAASQKWSYKYCKSIDW